MRLSCRVLEMQETAILVRSSFYIAIGCALLIALTHCGELSEYDNERIREALGDSLIQSSTTLNLDMDLIEGGKLKLNLQSSRAHTEKVQGTSTTYLSGPVRIQIFDADSLQALVSSDSAVYIPSASVFELFGGVFVQTTNGKRLSSDYLKWERKIDQVSTPGVVTIVTPTDSINAIGFTGDTDLNNYTLNEVTGTTVID